MALDFARVFNPNGKKMAVLIIYTSFDGVYMFISFSSVVSVVVALFFLFTFVG